MKRSLAKLIRRMLLESEETFDFVEIPDSNDTFELDDPVKPNRRLNPSDDPDKSRGRRDPSDRRSPSPSDQARKPQPPSTTTPPPADKTPPMSKPIVNRGEQMLGIANSVAEKFGLDDIEFVSKSTRPDGASAFFAYSDAHGDVILKLQPIEETSIYVALKKKSISFPKEVMKHFPKIYAVTTLENLGIEKPRLGGEGRDLGVIIMEPLSHLPGNLNDLLSLSGDRAAVDKRALYLLSDKSSYIKFVENFMSSPQAEDYLNRIERDPLTRSRRSDPVTPQDRMSAEERRDLLRRMLISLFYNKSLRDSLDRRDEDLRSSMMVFKREITKLVENWARSAGVVGTMVSGLTLSIIMDFETVLHHLGSRPIPRDPKRPGSEGPLGKLKGFESFNRAIDYLLDEGIVPGDLHANNLMIRPSTGDIVFSDLGHFKLR